MNSQLPPFVACLNIFEIALLIATGSFYVRNRERSFHLYNKLLLIAATAVSVQGITLTAWTIYYMYESDHVTLPRRPRIPSNSSAPPPPTEQSTLHANGAEFIDKTATGTELAFNFTQRLCGTLNSCLLHVIVWLQLKKISRVSADFSPRKNIAGQCCIGVLGCAIVANFVTFFVKCSFFERQHGGITLGQHRWIRAVFTTCHFGSLASRILLVAMVCLVIRKRCLINEQRGFDWTVLRLLTRRLVICNVVYLLMDLIMLAIALVPAEHHVVAKKLVVPMASSASSLASLLVAISMQNASRERLLGLYRVQCLCAGGAQVHAVQSDQTTTVGVATTTTCGGVSGVGACGSIPISKQLKSI